jgi:hypothetical protein
MNHDPEGTPPEPGNPGLRAWIAWFCLAATCVPLFSVLVSAASSGRAVAADAAGDPAAGAAPGLAAGSATAPQVAPVTIPAGQAAPSFGAAVPSEQFVQNFQQQVTRQLQSALSDAREQSESRMREWSEQQQQATLQLLQSQRSSDDARRERSGSSGDQDDLSSQPQVHSREAPAVQSRPGPGAQPERAEEMPTPDGGGLAGLPARMPALAIAAASGAGPRAAPGAGSDGPAREGAARRHNVSPHGFVAGRLLNGVIAVVGGPDRESIVALQGRYEGANGFASNLDGCLALVQGHSDPAAGRIDFKLSRLTCNFPGGASHTWDAAGWLVDADGIRGLRATLVANVGAKAALAAAGGAIDGLGQRLSQEQYRSASSPLGTSAAFQGNASRDALGGAASGSARSASQAMADAYNLFPPSLQVGGGTPVTVVLANDLRLPAQARATSPTFPATLQ